MVFVYGETVVFHSNINIYSIIYLLFSTRYQHDALVGGCGPFIAFPLILVEGSLESIFG